MEQNVSHGTLRRPIVRRMVNTLERIGAQSHTRGVMSTRLVRKELRLYSLLILNTKIPWLTLQSPARILANVWERIICHQSILRTRGTLRIMDQVANLGTRKKTIAKKMASIMEWIGAQLLTSGVTLESIVSMVLKLYFSLKRNTRTS